jgi:hypothetical protein
VAGLEQASPYKVLHYMALLTVSAETAACYSEMDEKGLPGYAVSLPGRQSKYDFHNL